jgi:hypothetical protein
MPKTRISCPNCRQPIVADIEQLYDVSANPEAKQRLLSGSYNLVQCPHCGYQGPIETPIVYHDPQKELLLTYIPPALNMPRNEQERLIGNLINQVVNRLPQEQRKGYLLRPQAVLTGQGLVERILEADGITREMIQAQQQRLNLIQRLVGAQEDVLAEVVKQEDKLIDADFFNLLSRLMEAAMAGGDQESARRMGDLQQKLLPLTTFGKKYQEQTREIEEAVRSLQQAGRELTREKLLDLVTSAPNDLRVSALVSLARAGMDYSFFQLLSEKIDRARGEGRERLIKLRERLLELTRELDRQMEVRTAQARELLNEILKEENISEATQASLDGIDDFFVHIVNEELEAARQAGDLGKLGKLQQVVNVLQQASAPPPEISLIEELLEVPDEIARRQWLEAHRQDLSPQFMDTLTSLMAQSQSSEDKELAERLQNVYRSALRFSMEANLNQ